jgi:predicted ABC-type ATPase
MQEKNFYIIAGPNGAGKTTLSKTVLKDVFNCQNFVNADEIAKGLSPLQAGKFDIWAGRIMLEQIANYIESGESFCVETTLSSRIYLNKIKILKSLGYKISLFFIYLPSVKLAIQRVKQRVLNGGHNVEKDIIKRRYKRGLANLISEYFDHIDNIHIYSNIENLEKIAYKSNDRLKIYNQKVFKKISKYKND